MTRASIGIGSNLGNPAANVRAAIAALARAGKPVATSHLYRSKPWGVEDQPDFCNAVALIDTELEPFELLDTLKAIEREMGRGESIRWGPRAIDLDILTYGEARLADPRLQIPHARLYERAFALVPLAEVNPQYAKAAAGLPRRERESVALMFKEPLVDRVRALAATLLETDLMRLRIEDPNEDAVELRRASVAAPRASSNGEAGEAAPTPPIDIDAIKADLVGIFHFSRPQVKEGEVLQGNRELAYVEALGIRNPVRSLGGGRIASVLCAEGQPVEYGQVLFEITRV